MKATDLMLGDWVIFRGRPHKVKGILSGLISLEAQSGIDAVLGDFDAFLEDLQPIPLTPEILEKNGFEKEENWWHLKEKGKTIFMVMRRWDGKFCFSVSIGVPIIQSIHQLQNALRLCEIEKEIII